MTPTRINVVGCSGSGKSTFCRRLASQLNAPYIELDALFWKPNWTETPDAEFLDEVEKRLKADRWVLDGNYAKTTPVKWRRVQTVIWLDYSFARILRQAITRAITRSYKKEELWAGTNNRETFRKNFLSRDSIILWTITSYTGLRKRYSQITDSDEYQHIEFVRLRSPVESENYLGRLAPSSTTAEIEKQDA